MSKLGQQVEWEEECARRGTEKYYASQDNLRDKGQGDTTDVMSFLIKDRLRETAGFLEDLLNKRSGGIGTHFDSVIKLAANGDYLKIAYIGLKSVLKAVQVKDKNTVLKVTLDIAAHIEADLKCSMFEATKPEYYDAVRRSMKEQNVNDYVHQHKVLMKKFSDFEIEWHDWTTSEKVHIGARILRSIVNTFGDVVFVYTDYNKGKKLLRLDTTPDFDIWAAEFEKERGLLYPTFLPLKIPPVPWTSYTDGGYHSPHLRLRFVKRKGKDHANYIADKFPLQHAAAVNKMQGTPWQINNDVLKVQEQMYTLGLGVGIPSSIQVQIPPFPEHLRLVEREDLDARQKEEVREWKVRAKSCYGKEQQRKGQVLAFMQGHKLAKELRDWDEFYFTYTCDFRGRIYCATSGLSPQGADAAKGLLRFARPVVLGHAGIKWLAIQGANTYGEDKITYEERVKWIRDREGFIKSVVEDPISSREVWGAADKPYQFLAFCFEWARCNYGKNPDAVGHLPIGLDGSCNGLQHFSAMLRDEVGAKATNLVPTNKPEDIYKQVADLVIEKLKLMDHPMASKWLQVGITRKCAKRPVMTLPYGATQQAARMYIMEYTIDNWGAFNLDPELQWEYAKFLTPILWTSIGEVVIAARTAMAWLQKNAGKSYAKWMTPIRFPVYQFYKNVKRQRIPTHLDGMVYLTINDFNREGEPAVSKQRNGIAPNFVHSIDSTHMVMTVNGTDLESYAMIHDDYGTHAGNTEHLYKAIRLAFYKLYTKSDPLRDWAIQMGVNVNSMPERGTYDIRNIVTSEYFFG